MKRTIPALLILAACAGDANDPPPQPPGREEPPTLPSRAEIREDTILLEGMPEVVTGRLYRAPEGFPLPFSTYLPEGLAPESVQTNAGQAVRIVAEFGGRRNENAYLRITALPAGTTEAEARELARSLAGDGARLDDAPSHPWAIAEYHFTRRTPGNPVGFVALGSHGDRFFTIMAHYPAEYGDGLGPRIAYILEHWRWEDSGRGLE